MATRVRGRSPALSPCGMNEVRLREAPRVSSRGRRGDLREGHSKKRRGAKAKPDLPRDVDRTCPATPEARIITARPLSNYSVNVNLGRPRATPSKKAELRTGSNYWHRHGNHSC